MLVARSLTSVSCKFSHCASAIEFLGTTVGNLLPLDASQARVAVLDDMPGPLL
jgi:hypothetical protein